MAPPPKQAAPSQGLELANIGAAGQIAIVLALVAVVLVGYYMAFYTTLQQNLASEQNRRNSLRSQIDRVRAEERQYNDDVAELNRRRSHARDLQRVLPDTADMPGFMRNINTLAEASGLSIRLIQPSDERTEQYFVRLPVRLDVAGSYLALARFFRAVSQLPRVINMENITLEAPAVVNGDVVLQAHVLATTFRALPTPPPAANARPAGGH
jgi:type IV pilus assembly protein PilO